MTLIQPTFKETSYILLVGAVEQAQTLHHGREEIQALLDTAEFARQQENIERFYAVIGEVKEKIRLALN